MKRIIIILLFGAFITLTACGKELETNMASDVQPFEFTTQDNQPMGLEDLKGQWWIADFIFTNCTTVCLPMTNNMANLQKQMKEENVEVQLISFSVDPAYDTPDVLKEYAESYQANLSNWAFLTGYDFETIKELSEGSFRSSLVPPPEGDDQVMHGTSFFLVNPDGQIVKRYDGTNHTEIDKIISDLKIVLK